MTLFEILVCIFLGIIALQTSGIVVDHPATLVTLGDLKKLLERRC